MLQNQLTLDSKHSAEGFVHTFTAEIFQIHVKQDYRAQKLLQKFLVANSLHHPVSLIWPELAVSESCTVISSVLALLDKINLGHTFGLNCCRPTQKS